MGMVSQFVHSVCEEVIKEEKCCTSHVSLCNQLECATCVVTHGKLSLAIVVQQNGIKNAGVTSDPTARMPNGQQQAHVD